MTTPSKASMGGLIAKSDFFQTTFLLPTFLDNQYISKDMGSQTHVQIAGKE